jgi:6-phosphogluconolactonase
MDSKYHGRIAVSPSKEEAAQQCSTHILRHLGDALQARGRATLAISGGTTPKLLFAEMAKASFDWSNVHVFWVDERCVPPTDDQSNYKLANETLLLPAKIPAGNIHRVLGELPPEEGAQRYIEDIKRVFSLGDGSLPVFEVIHRGIGSDAHTASLFPGEPLIANRDGIAAAVWVEKMKSHRVTLLPGVLLAARATVIQAAGSDKAEPIHNVLEGPDDPFQFPCQIAARDSANTVWFIDQPAAAKL